MRWVLLVAASSTFLIYGYAIQKLFLREGGIDPRMKALQLAGTTSAIVHVWAIWKSGEIGALQSGASFVLYTIGLATFYAAKHAASEYPLTLAFSSDEPKGLLRRGIYARIRHPFYAAYATTWIAGIVAAPSLWTGFTTFMMIGAYLFAARLEERKFAASALAVEYADYRSRTGLFWPWW